VIVVAVFLLRVAGYVFSVDAEEALPLWGELKNHYIRPE
jgi:hypothetical protein